mgnify:CR=1 FL=1
MSKSFVLASGSPRRKALLEDLGLDIDVRVSDADEIDHLGPEAVVLHNAGLKCDAVAQDASDDEVIIAADTIVVLGKQILGKPKSLDEAKSMLRNLSGNTHCVMTGVAVRGEVNRPNSVGVEITEVTFCPLSEKDIDTFVHTVQPLDRAGAYTVDGPGGLLVAGYNGCYYNVLGLPLVRLQAILHHFDIDLFNAMDPEKTRFL